LSRLSQNCESTPILGNLFARTLLVTSRNFTLAAIWQVFLQSASLQRL
jgi:hypothetical protein